MSGSSAGLELLSYGGFGRPRERDPANYAVGVLIRHWLLQPQPVLEYPSIGVLWPPLARLFHGHSHLAGISNPQVTCEWAYATCQLCHTNDRA